jgi:hypothetical protein
MEENELLKEKIIKLEKEIYELKNNHIESIKLNINNYLLELQKNNDEIVDINKDLYIFIQNIKNNYENKLKNNKIIHFCNYLLNEIEQNNINNIDLKGHINILMNFL